MTHRSAHIFASGFSSIFRAGVLLALLLFLISGCSSGLFQNSSPASDSSEGTAASASGQTAAAEFFAMDTFMSITAFGVQAQDAVDAAEQEVYRLENVFSRILPTSEISRINAQSGQGPVVVSKETFDLISSAVIYTEKTKGAFDITIAPIMDMWGFSDGNYRVPAAAEIQAALPLIGSQKIRLDSSSLTVELPDKGMKLDLGGIAKGYTSDMVQKVLREYNILSAIISLGGNVAVFGTKADGSLWKTAISDPNEPASYIGVLKATDTSVITSGGYERNFTLQGITYIHIVDPSTGLPVHSDLLSVSIISPDGVQGDCLSTALFVMGKDKAISYWKEHRDFACILVTAAGEVLASTELKNTFTLSDTEGSLTFFE